MIHVSRNDRVALDWLFVRINLQPKIEIKYVDKPTRVDRRKFQLNEWSFFYIMNFLMFSAAISAMSCLVQSGTSAPRQEDFRKRLGRDIGSGEAESCEFEPLEHEESSFARVKRPKQPG